MRTRFLLLVLLLFSISSFGQVKNFTVDVSITGFKKEHLENGRYYYTSVGDYTSIRDKNLTHFMIRPMQGLTKEKAQRIIKHMVSRPRERNTSFSNIRTEEVTFNGYSVYILECVSQEDGRSKKANVYYAYIIGENTAVMYAAIDHFKGIYMERLKATARSIVLK